MDWNRHRNRIKNYENKDNHFDSKSYERGHHDGYDDGYEDAEFIIVSTMYDQWDDFIETCSKYKTLNEFDWIKKMIEYFKF